MLLQILKARLESFGLSVYTVSYQDNDDIDQLLIAAHGLDGLIQICYINNILHLLIPVAISKPSREWLGTQIIIDPLEADFLDKFDNIMFRFRNQTVAISLPRLEREASRFYLSNSRVRI